MDEGLSARSRKSRRIICTDVPVDLLDKNVAKKHFRQFGRVLRILIRPKSRSLIIEYDCTENAEVAVANQGDYQGHPFSIKWYGKPVFKRKHVDKDRDPDWVPDSEVQQELDAMAALGHNSKKSYNLRPELMSLDVFPIKQESLKSKKTVHRTWKTENPRKPNTKTLTESSRIWTPEQLELLGILKQAALTTEEKFKVLEARDKLIRLRSKKDMDLTTTTHTVGTCPDMCPEKERLMRETQHQVAVYEQDSTGRGMNPNLAIKQYSRSSADQEVPLPHELRPVSVLQLTMNYLMYRIMNLCDLPDVNLAEWYHFLWDRTRSIRKDITQQELCSQGSVSLLEQCARFHIHCSARLASEDPSAFDQKINTENLTKSLQTLKYMYHDLHLKGESCRNEAEFRSYIILLNLNDGNFMWEVQQLKQEIQKSPEVRFALQVYSAIDENNFVKFFKLVHSTGYLPACILLRYFVQVRTRALATILKSYSPRASYTQFSLFELQNLLAFEDLDSTVDFVTSYGLYLNQEETHVVLNRKTYQLPEIPYALDRAVGVVESKKRKSSGEVVCGGPLSTNFENYVPSNSFNESGVLIVSGLLADLMYEARNAPVTEVSTVEDQTDSARRSSPVEVFQKQSTATPVAPNIFGTGRVKTADASLPFWSSKTVEPPSSSGIFGAKPKTDQPTKQFQFQLGGDQAPKPSIFGEFGEQPKPTMFGENSQSSTIFAVPTKPQSPFGQALQPQAAFGGETSHLRPVFSEIQPSNIFGGPQLREERPKDPRSYDKIFGVEKPRETSVEAQKSFSFGIKPASSSVFGGSSALGHRDEAPKVCIDESKPSFSFDSGLVKSSASQEVVGIKPFVPVARSPIKSPRLEQEEADRARLEELERQRKLQKEKEESLKRDLELMKRKAEARMRQLEEERRRKEEERLELEKQKRLAEEKRIALLIENERKQSLEIKKAVHTLMQDLLTEVEENLKQQRLQEIACNIRNHKTTLFIKKWRQRNSVNKRKRQAMEQNPIWLPSRTAEEEAEELFTVMQNQNLENIKRYRYGQSMEIILPPEDHIAKMDVADIYDTLLRSYHKIYQRPQKEMFWKVTVSLPDFREFKVGLNIVEDVLRKIFQWKDRYGSTAIIGQYTAENRLSYCVEKKQGAHVVENDSNGLLFVAHEPNELLIQRIRESLKNFPKLSLIPIAVILVNNNTTSICVQDLGGALEADRHVTNYDILACKFTNSALVDAVDQSLAFLALSIESPPPLELDSLQSFLHVNLAIELWKRISSYAIWNSKYRACLKSPNLVINLYNDGVERLKEIAFERSCLEYRDFPDEFDKLLMDRNPVVLPCDYKYFPAFWKSESYRALVLHLMNSIKLPRYEPTWPPANEKDLEQDIFDYCSLVFAEPQKVFYKIMAVILQQVEFGDDFEQVKSVLWSDVVEVVALEKLQEADFLLHHTEFHSKSIFQEYVVVYNVVTLGVHREDEWFYLKNPLVEAEIRQNTPVVNRVFKRKVPEVEVFDDFDLDALEKSIRRDDTVVQNKTEVAELESFMADLEKSMEIHKKICVSFEKTVQMALNSGK